MRGWLRLANDTLLNTPVLWINKYLQSKIADSTGLDTPFFPTLPSTINDLTQYFPTGGTMATWDRLIKMNKKSFPHIKCEQIMYYFYANGENPIEKMVQIQEQVLRLMDRGNETAEEVNNWASNRQVNLGTVQSPDLIDNMFYFHDFKVYQLEESRDIIDFGTARTYGGNKIIIEYDYHAMPELTGADWTPEQKLAIKQII
jgi:hypothetical protein